MIIPLSASDYPALIQLWEASVRASHHFLREEDIFQYKLLIYKTYFEQVELLGYVDKTYVLQGFIGLAENQIRMLFVHPNYHKQGIGKALMNFALTERAARYVDVNEQNEQALAFYKHLGFEIIDRSALDNAGKPYPVLRMKWKVEGKTCGL